MLGMNFCQAKSFKYTYKGITFKCKIIEGGVEIYGFDMKADQVVIPAQVSNEGATYQVKSIDTFLNGVNYLASKLVIEEGVESIESRAFMEFRNLKEITLPKSIQMGKNVFRPNLEIAINYDNVKHDIAYVEPKPSPPLKTTEKTKSESKPSTKSESKPSAKSETKQTTKSETKQTTKSETKQTTKQTPKPEPKPTPKPEPKPVPDPDPVIDGKPDIVDTDIPVRRVKNREYSYCVIIANEHYRDVSEVEYAINDGHVFKEYCKKTLGIPERNIRSYFDATYTDMKRAISWMEDIADATDGKARLFLYYAGHGIPNDKDQSAYLIPTDGFPKDITTCFKLSDIYDRLARMNVENVTVLLDACFSGVKRGEGQSIVAARGVAIKAKKEDLSGNLVILTAASDDETAFSYKSKKHGMFTYYLLKKLHDSKGEISLGEVYNFINSNVKKSSMEINDKKQTPSINVSPLLKDKWQTLRF